MARAQGSNMPLAEILVFIAVFGSIAATPFIVIVLRKRTAVIRVIERELFETRTRLDQLVRLDEVRAADMSAAGDHIVQLRRQIGELAASCDRLPSQVADQGARVERLERHDEIRAADVSAAGDHIVQLRQQIAELVAYCDRLPSQVADQGARVERLERHDEIRAADVSAAGDHIDQLRQQIAELVAYCDRLPIARFADQESRVERLEQHDEVRAVDVRTAGDHIAQLRQELAELVAYCDRLSRGQLADQGARVERLERHDEIRAADVSAAGDHIVQLRQRIAELAAYCDRLPSQVAHQESRVDRLERHDGIRAADITAASDHVVQLRQQIGDLVAFCDQLGSLPEQRDLAGLHQRLARLKDDLQERSLRRDLETDPFAFDLSYSLVALLHRQGRAPLPELPALEAKGIFQREDIGSASLLNEAASYAEKGDTIGHYACLWQLTVRYPRSARGWAEYAKSLGERQEWAHCRQALFQLLSFKVAADRATAEAALTALATLAVKGQMTDLAWREWFDSLSPEFQRQLQAAALLSACGDVDSAGALLPSLLIRKHLTADDWIAAANVAFEREDWTQAYHWWRRAFETDLPRTLRTAVTNYGARLSYLLRETRRDDELADWLSDESFKHDQVSLMPTMLTPESARHAAESRSRAIERGLPSVFFIPQSKSASVTISSLFGHGFGLVTAVYSLVDRRVVAPWLADYQRGGACYTTHLIPSVRNVEMLSSAASKSTMIVNVRDPRQWVVSVAGHVEKYPQEMPPSARAAGSRDAALSWAINERCPQLIDWIDGWVEASSTLPIHFTSYEEFVGDREAFVERILSLYGGDRRYFDRDAAFNEQSGIDYHRRVGAVDEWRSVLSREQMEAINRMIPQRLWEKFGWQ
ncbi:MAG: hypothetical protein WAV02_04910 [Stellaceae bacterium]